MTELEKIVVFGKLCEDLKGIVFSAGHKGLWLETDAFENCIKALDINEIKNEWYSDCNEQAFYYNDIRFYTIYSKGDDAYIPQPEIPDSVYEEVKAEVEK